MLIEILDIRLEKEVDLKNTILRLNGLERMVFYHQNKIY